MPSRTGPPKSSEIGSQNLSTDVPEGDVDAADDVCGCAAGAHVCERPEDFISDHFDQTRIVAGYQLAYVLECGADGSI
jgi:hypothetical protein